ncbi:TetR/AcrR family transcriptional regulator [Microbispora bryophytorum]|uniref:TetR/AcrR family transcriptional regulator n=1 Tax=Microbispora bryophytorum subsp. camponoti TaxID=1677852 RepID=A0ABR8L425_9ACTN|nr:TetR/AcrR family transcriptional regulator [Microbispora camponoti]MBD3145701.1 TetR/AcrR family transcriptional regulator [Microbispora camponoti]
MTETLGLRERKKRQTRSLISDVASGLFMQRGFDNVTVAEVAEAAGVSTKTVFNYFPRKEDLFLDRYPEAVELVTQAVRERAEGESPLAALRRLFLGMLREGHPLGGIAPGYEVFWQVILDSPALRARARELVEEFEGVLAGLFAEAVGSDPAAPADRAALADRAAPTSPVDPAGSADPAPRLAAALVVAAYRAVYVTSIDRIRAGDPVPDVIADRMVQLDRALLAVERAVAAF